MKHYEYCPTCDLPIPDKMFGPHSVPCSESHVRCIRCEWPVAKKGPRGQPMIDADGICDICKEYARRRVERKNNSQQ